jgi:hypothetical protein
LKNFNDPTSYTGEVLLEEKIKKHFGINDLWWIFWVLVIQLAFSLSLPTTSLGGTSVPLFFFINQELTKALDIRLGYDILESD